MSTKSLITSIFLHALPVVARGLPRPSNACNAWIATQVFGKYAKCRGLFAMTTMLDHLASNGTFTHVLSWIALRSFRYLMTGFSKPPSGPAISRDNQY